MRLARYRLVQMYMVEPRAPRVFPKMNFHKYKYDYRVRAVFEQRARISGQFLSFQPPTRGGFFLVIV